MKAPPSTSCDALNWHGLVVVKHPQPRGSETSFLDRRPGDSDRREKTAALCSALPWPKVVRRWQQPFTRLGVGPLALYTGVLRPRERVSAGFHPCVHVVRVCVSRRD